MQLARLPCSLLRRSSSSTRCFLYLPHCTRRQHIASTSTLPPSQTETSAPLRLDPPFTPVPGEMNCLQQQGNQQHVTNTNEVPVLYLCQGCSTPLFASVDYAAGSAVGQHRNGWPRFTQPVTPHALVVRGVRQRLTTKSVTFISHESSACTSEQRSTNTTNSLQQPTATSSSSSKATMRLPYAEVQMAYSGLPVERDIVHTIGQSTMKVIQRPTWRERCLRDANKRGDPSLLEGVCAHCGKAVCRLSMTRRDGLCYVTTASAVKAVLAEGKSV